MQRGVLLKGQQFACGDVRVAHSTSLQLVEGRGHTPVCKQLQLQAQCMNVLSRTHRSRVFTRKVPGQCLLVPGCVALCVGASHVTPDAGDEWSSCTVAGRL